MERLDNGIRSDFVYLGTKPIARITSNSPSYIFGDYQNSPLFETNSSGTVTRSPVYLGYGNPDQTGVDEIPGYAGGTPDQETGEVYLGARYTYHARFLSPDPAPLDPTNPVGLNRYAYANDNPVRYTDPTGQQSEGETDPAETEAERERMQEIFAPKLVPVDPQAGWSPNVADSVVKEPSWSRFSSKYEKAGQSLLEPFATKKEGTNRNPNKLAPDDNAVGPHSSFRRGPDGRTTNYETYDRNPHTGQWGSSKRFRGEGKLHGGVEPPLILDRPVGKGPGSRPIVPRTPEAWELPNGY